MGRGNHVGSNKRFVIYLEGLWAFQNGEADRTVATSLVYPLRARSPLRSIPNLPSYGSGLGRSC